MAILRRWQQLNLDSSEWVTDSLTSLGRAPSSSTKDKGDGEVNPIFFKVDLGAEILGILRGILEDEMPGHMTDTRFCPHTTIFSRCNLSPELKAKLFKTADHALMNYVTIREMSLRQKKTAVEHSMEPIMYQFCAF